MASRKDPQVRQQRWRKFRRIEGEERARLATNGPPSHLGNLVVEGTNSQTKERNGTRRWMNDGRIRERKGTRPCSKQWAKLPCPRSWRWVEGYLYRRSFHACLRIMAKEARSASWPQKDCRPGRFKPPPLFYMPDNSITEYPSMDSLHHVFDGFFFWFRISLFCSLLSYL